MVWTAPMTAVSGNAFTAVQFNTYVRDNLLETAPAKATTTGSIFVGAGANSIAERVPATSSINVSETTTSGTFVDLATPGPSVSVTTGTSALAIWTVEGTVNTASEAARASVGVSGATTVAASTNWQLRIENEGPGSFFSRAASAHLFTGLNAGSNTFKIQYAASTGGTTATFNWRELIVIPF